MWRLADLLNCSEALQLGGAEAVLLLQGRSLQHQMLLLSGVHLLEVLSCSVWLSVKMLENLKNI